MPTIYMTYPTTSKLRPSSSTSQVRVNNRHTNVGCTTDISVRKRDYERTFSGEIEFVVLGDVPEGIESEILRILRNQFSRVGRTQRWFETDDHDAVRNIVKQLIEKNGGKIR